MAGSSKAVVTAKKNTSLAGLAFSGGPRKLFMETAGESKDELPVVKKVKGAIQKLSEDAMEGNFDGDRSIRNCK